jgi:hypothetical protein
MHTLPGVFYVFFIRRHSLVVRSADWSPEITGFGVAATSRFIPLPAQKHIVSSAQALLLYTISPRCANIFSGIHVIFSINM